MLFHIDGGNMDIEELLRSVNSSDWKMVPALSEKYGGAYSLALLSPLRRLTGTPRPGSANSNSNGT
jgi:hypothetical protein